MWWIDYTVLSASVWVREKDDTLASWFGSLVLMHDMA
jgi:hypothetical protein